MKNQNQLISSFLHFTLIFTALWLFSQRLDALTFPLPSPGNDVVGKVQWTQARPGDTFSIIGRRYDIGYFELVEANPGIDPDNIPPGTIIVVPTKFILPPVARTGIVISIAELRVYYYPPNSNTVVTYPVGVGREGWCTPVGITKIVTKDVDPVWVVPKSIQQDRAAQGIILPDSVKPGPDNPLGGYRMRLGIQSQTFLMHGTDDFTGVGRRSSSGCIRMFPEDVEALFSMVSVGTQVNIVDTPYKAGWNNGKLYFEAHVPLQEQQNVGSNYLSSEMNNTVQAAIKPYTGVIYWDQVKKLTDEQNGIPQVIGHKSGTATSDDGSGNS